jgi:CRISPR-associated protein Cas2
MMTILIVEGAPNRLKGRLTLWMSEIKTGVYVADCNRKMREWIWKTVKENIGRGSALIVWSTSRAEFGYDMDFVGSAHMEVVEYDGIKLMADRKNKSRRHSNK